MSKTITLNLRKDLIMEAVMAETYDVGRLDKNANPVDNAAAGSAEQAGGEAYQERVLLRYLKAAVSRFEAQMAEFLEAGNGSISNTLTAASQTFTVVMIVGDRYNNGLASPMSSLCEDYLVNQMLYNWWKVRKPDYATGFAASARDDIDHVRLCMSKTAPAAASGDYTDVNGTVTNS